MRRQEMVDDLHIHIHEVEKTFPQEVEERAQPLLTAYEVAFGSGPVCRLSAYQRAYGWMTFAELREVAATHDADNEAHGLPVLDHAERVDRASAEHDRKQMAQAANADRIREGQDDGGR
jgi:hypothetical protein